MATTNVQMASVPMPSDIPVQNYSASVDIAAYQCIVLDTGNLVTNSATALNGGVSVILPTVVDSTHSADAFGITQEIIKAGQTGRVRTGGISLAIADGAITAGAWVDASTTTAKVGKVRAHVAANQTIGIALETAADGDTIQVLVLPGKNA